MPAITLTALAFDEGPHVDILQRAGFEVRLPAPGLSLSRPDHLVAALEGCEAVAAGSEPYTRQVLERLPQLRVIARRGVGFDAIDLAACDDFDVVVTTTVGTLHDCVAEHAIAMLLAVGRGFPRLDQQVRAGRWQRRALPRVQGKTLGIVGIGSIGRATAWRAAGLGMQVVAHDPVLRTEAVEVTGLQGTPLVRVPLLGLEELLARSEFVSLHLPYSPELKHAFNAARFAQMKPGAVFINTARGALVDEAALCEALRSGHLAGAALDVFNQEPLPVDSPLLAFDNVLLSGHVAGLDVEANHDIAVKLAETVVELYQGGWPAACIRNPRLRPGWSWHAPRRPR